jgi:acetyltransferase EpsM
MNVNALIPNQATARIVVAGAGGLGSEIRDAIECASSLPIFAGFLDDVPGPEVIGSITPETVPQDCALVLAMGDSRIRHMISLRFTAFDRWATVCHPSSVVSPRANVGVGSYIGAFAYIGPDACVGAHTVINIQSQVGHGSTLGDFVTLSPYAATNGTVTLGKGVFLGTAATVAPGVRIGDWTNVAAGSRVTKDFGALHLLHGNPARGREIYCAPEGS